MEQDIVTQAEHKEFVKRVEAAHNRYDKRLEQNEAAIEEIRSVQADIKAINLNIERILTTLSKQEERLNTLEDRDGEMWRKCVGYVVTAIIGIVVGYLFTALGM